MTPLSGFLAPAMLAGAAAVAVPLALHFFYKPRYRKQPWAAMTFLKLSLEQTSRRVKFQEYVLLALRCLALILLALALARPTVSAVTAGRGEGVDAVLVIDTSYSLGAADGDVDRFARAKTAAVAVIDNLPPNSTVQVVTCADRATAVGPRSPGNLDDARRVVAELKLTSLSGDLLPGLMEAAAALDRVAGATKEVYLVSDLQKTTWAKQSAAVRAAAAELKTRATLAVVRCGDPARPLTNVAVTALTTPGGIPHTGSRLPVTVMVQNTGPTPARNLTVTLEVDGKDAEKESAAIDELPAGQAAPVTLTARLDLAGNRLITARVQSDEVGGDNRLDRIIAVRDAVRVLIVDGAPDERDPKQSASHFVRNALVPVPADRLADYHVQATTVSAASAGLLGTHDVCVLCNAPVGPGGLSPAFVTRLAEFVRAGGGLIIGGGDQVLVPAYNAALGSAGAKLLPFNLTEPITASAEQPLKLAPDTADPAGFLARFRDEPYRTATADADLTSALGMADADTPGSAVLMRLTTGRPWAAGRRVGEGEVVVVASLDATGGTWPAKAGSYLSFVQTTLAHLAGKSAAGFNRPVGSPLVWHPAAAPNPFELIGPDGTRTKLGPATGGAGTALTVATPDTLTAGVYRMTEAGIDPPTGPAFAVAADLRESADLANLTDAETEELLGFRPVMLSAGGPSGGTDFATERSRREWTVWVLAGLFAVAAAELAWAWRCGRA